MPTALVVGGPGDRNLHAKSFCALNSPPAGAEKRYILAVVRSITGWTQNAWGAEF